MTFRKTWVGVENLEEPMEQEAELMEVPSETIESELVEIEGQDKEIEALVEDGEELEGDQESMEELIDNAEESLEDEGMDETAARATEIAAEGFSAKYGIRRRRVGMEQFGSASSRRHATMVAVEDLKSTASDMWESFVAWLKEIIAKVRDQILKLTNAGKSLKKRATRLETRLDKGLGSKNKDKVKGSFITQCTIDGTVDWSKMIEVAEASKDVAVVASKGKDLVKEGEEAAKATGKGEPAILAGAEKVTRTVKNVVDELGKKLGKKTSKNLKGMIPEGASDVTAEALPGGAYMVSWVKDGVANLRYVSNKDGEKSKEVATLSEQEMEYGIKSLFTLGDALETKLKAFRDVTDQMDKLAGEVKSAKDSLKDAKGDDRNTAKKALKTAQAASKAANEVNRAVLTTMKTAGSGIAGYIEASMNAYKKAG